MGHDEGTETFAVWWLSPADCDAIGEDVDGRLWPPYIKEEYASLVGRVGRGRLWVSHDLNAPPAGINWDVAKLLARHAEECGGIVIKAEDALYVATLPGMITDMSLNAWETS